MLKVFQVILALSIFLPCNAVNVFRKGIVSSLHKGKLATLKKQSSFLISGSFQKSAILKGASNETYVLRFEGLGLYKLDSVIMGTLEWGYSSKLGYLGSVHRNWEKSEDLTVAHLSWSRLSLNKTTTTLVMQIQSSVVNSYNRTSKILESGLFLPSTVHLSYGWSLNLFKFNGKLDLLPCDLRFRTYKEYDGSPIVRTAEMGAFFRFRAIQSIRSKYQLISIVDGEFSNLNRDGYGIRASLRFDWRVWGALKVSMLAEAERDRPTGQSRWSGLVTLGYGVDQSR